MQPSVLSNFLRKNQTDISDSFGEIGLGSKKATNLEECHECSEDRKKNIGATACTTWPRAETFNGQQKVLQILYNPGPTIL